MGIISKLSDKLDEVKNKISDMRVNARVDAANREVGNLKRYHKYVDIDAHIFVQELPNITPENIDEIEHKFNQYGILKVISDAKNAKQQNDRDKAVLKRNIAKAQNSVNSVKFYASCLPDELDKNVKFSSIVQLLNMGQINENNYKDVELLLNDNIVSLMVRASAILTDEKLEFQGIEYFKKNGIKEYDYIKQLSRNPNVLQDMAIGKVVGGAVGGMYVASSAISLLVNSATMGKLHGGVLDVIFLYNGELSDTDKRDLFYSAILKEAKVLTSDEYMKYFYSIVYNDSNCDFKMSKRNITVDSFGNRQFKSDTDELAFVISNYIIKKTIEPRADVASVIENKTLDLFND